MTYPISEISGIGPDVADRLKSAGIRTTARLLDAAKGPKERKRLAEKTGLDEKRILSWANTADRMRIKGVGADYAGLLQAAGVDTVKELKYRNPGQARPRHGRGQRQAQARPRPALRPRRRALDRAGQAAAAQDHLLIARVRASIRALDTAVRGAQSEPP